MEIKSIPYQNQRIFTILENQGEAIVSGPNVIKLLYPKFTNIHNKLEYSSLASLSSLD